MSDFHALVPRQPEANMEFRLKVLEGAKADPRRQRFLMAACRADILFWINGFVVQYNPNSIGEASEEIGPFITWDFQDEAVRVIRGCLEDRESLAISKSRDMGASWLCLLVMLWYVLFHDWKKFLCISRNADAVDKPGDSDSLFWKLDFVVGRLPGWMTKEYWNRRKMVIDNPKKGGSVTGQASTGAAGVGGRCWGAFIDEFPRIKEDRDVLQSMANTTACRIFNGTHRGTNTAFYDITLGKAAHAYRQLMMHWSQHPDKKKGLYRYDVATNVVEILDKSYVFPADYQFDMTGHPTGGPYPGLRSPWYDKKAASMGDSRGVAMDLDIDPQGSKKQFFDPILLGQLRAAYCIPPLWEGDVVYDRESGDGGKLVKRAGGRVKLWINPLADGSIPPGQYCFGCDTSAGSGATNSCLSGGDGRTGEKVLEYADPFIKPEDFGVLTVALAKMFKNEYGTGAFVIVECPGAGQTMLQKVVDIKYTNIYYRVSEFEMIRGVVSKLPGWYGIDPNVKDHLIKMYNAALTSRAFINRSEPALKECLDFEYMESGHLAHTGESKTADPSGARGNHGDRVIADALANKGMETIARVGKSQKDIDAKPGTLAYRMQQAHEQESMEGWR